MDELQVETQYANDDEQLDNIYYEQLLLEEEYYFAFTEIAK